MQLTKKIGLFLGPILFFLIQFLPITLVSEKADAVIAVAIWMVIWWITETVNIAVTALLPLILFPLLQIMEIAAVGANYGSPIIFLFFGGFVLALALEKVNLHKRIALFIRATLAKEITEPLCKILMKISICEKMCCIYGCYIQPIHISSSLLIL